LVELGSSLCFAIHVFCELSPTNRISVCYSSLSLKLVISDADVVL